jgi:glucose-6-phosphate isomerase
LFEKGRQSISLTVRDCSAFTVGVLIALFERAVGLYASLVNINAYHQPGVEAGKKAAAGILDLQARGIAALKADPTKSWTASTLAQSLGGADSAESLFLILRHLAANGRQAKIVGGQGTDTLFQAA